MKNFKILVILCISLLSEDLYGQDFLKVWNSFQEASSKTGYQYVVDTYQIKSYTAVKPDSVEKTKGERMELRVNKNGVLCVVSNTIIWYGRDKTITTNDQSKSVTVVPLLEEKNKEAILQATHLSWIDSLVANSKQIQVTKVTEGLYEYHYTFSQTNPVVLTLFYQTGSLFFYKIQFSQTISGVVYHAVQEISNFSTLVDERFMSESYFIVKQGNTYVPSSYFKDYQLYFTGYVK
jgi:hypothetical protein